MDTKNSSHDSDEIISGKNSSNIHKGLAYFSIVIIYFFYCYNFMVGAFVKPTMIAEISAGGFGFTLKQTEEIFAIMSFGTIPGTILFGIITSKIGKKYTIISVAMLISLTTLLPMFNPESIGLWTIARFCTGVTLGGVFGTAMPLIADMFPKKYRGKLSASLTALYSLAMIFGGQIYGFLGDSNWKLLMYTAIIPPIIGAIMTFFFVPNDYKQAQELIKEGKETGEKISYFSMYKGKYLYIGLGVILLSGANFTGYSLFSNNATTYLTVGLGVTSATAGAIYSLQGVGQLFGYLIWGAIADKFGRKVPAIGMLLSAVLVFVYLQIGVENISGFYVVSVLLGFMFGFSGVWGAYYTELFPDKYRSISAGISFNGGRIISSFSLPLIAGMVVQSNMIPIFLVSMGVFVAGAAVWFFLPETITKKNK